MCLEWSVIAMYSSPAFFAASVLRGHRPEQASASSFDLLYRLRQMFLHLRPESADFTHPMRRESCTQ